MNPVLPMENVEIFFDGIFSEPRLRHPEGVTIDEEGNVWCGGEGGEIYRIRRDGSDIELVASTEGFTLGLAFDGNGNLYTCDLKHASVFRLSVADGSLEPFADGSEGRKIRIPNFPVVDQRRNCLYVSDSYDMEEPGPGIWKFGLDTGEGDLWYDRPMTFANGMALSSEGDFLYVAETFARKITRIPILEDGTAGESVTFVEGIERLPDGLAFDAGGNLYVSCYEPSRIYRVSPDRKIDLLVDDPEAHTLCHPTNCAFRGEELFTSNLGRWHITRIDVGTESLSLP
jgi:sugar lactone lactonase YvrE